MICDLDKKNIVHVLRNPDCLHFQFLIAIHAEKLKPYQLSTKPSSGDTLFKILCFCFVWAFFFPDCFCSARHPGNIGFLVENAEKESVLTGYSRSKTSMVVSSEVTGKIISIHYDIGDSVGDEPLIEIDPTFIDFEIQSLRKMSGLLENSFQRADEQVRFYEKEFNRMDALYKENSASGIKRDAAEQEMIQSRLQREHASIELEKMKVSLKELLERKKRHQIFAPAGWKMVGRMVEEGELVMKGTPLARAADFRTLVVPLSVSGKELEAILALAPEFNAYLEKEPVKAAMRWINPEFDEKTRKLGIEILITHYPGEKRGGLLFSLPLKIPVPGVQIPKASVIRRYENPKVQIKDSGETVNVLVMDETDGHLIIAEDPRLLPGTVLADPSGD